MQQPSLLIQGNRGRCSMCPKIEFIAGAANETVSILKQFEAHCRKAHPSKREHKNAVVSGKRESTGGD
jgi:hypothetical protein